MYSNHKSTLLSLLEVESDLSAKEWWEGYVKESAPFLGVKMADIRNVVHLWYKNQIAGNLDVEQQVDLALSIIEGKYTEEKLAGTLFLQEILIPSNAIQCDSDIKRFAGLFINRNIYDWNVCDWFCVKTLGTLIKKEGNRCATKIIAWHSSENLWQARASLVAFVPVADNAEYYYLIGQACSVVVRREERFAKTAVGWILRDISKHNMGFVDRVVTENIGYFTLESLTNATKYYNKEEKSKYRQLLKGAS